MSYDGASPLRSDPLPNSGWNPPSENENDAGNTGIKYLDLTLDSKKFALKDKNRKFKIAAVVVAIIAVVAALALIIIFVAPAAPVAAAGAFFAGKAAVVAGSTLATTAATSAAVGGTAAAAHTLVVPLVIISVVGAIGLASMAVGVAICVARGRR